MSYVSNDMPTEHDNEFSQDAFSFDLAKEARKLVLSMAGLATIITILNLYAGMQ